MPIVKVASEVPAKSMEGQAVGVSMRILISPDQGAPNFIMRLFTVEPGGRTPLHTHPWEHEVFILEGRGVVGTETAEVALQPEHSVYVAPGERHYFRNTGDAPLRFICVVPTEKNYTHD